MNIFNKIGNQIEKRKKQRKILTDKYWKLSATERMDYDNKVERIERDSRVNFFYLPMTWLISKIVLSLVAFIFLVSFSVSFPLSKLIELLKPLSLLLTKVILFTMIFDVFIMFIRLIFDDSDKRLKKLNKRFKLK